jgi:hypothetical protein
MPGPYTLEFARRLSHAVHCPVSQACGIHDIKDAAGCTIAQDETTSVVSGMPKAAICVEVAAIVGKKKNGMPGRQEHTVL